MRMQFTKMFVCRVTEIKDLKFQALKMYLNCVMHPCTLLKHVQFVNNVLMYIVLL